MRKGFNLFWILLFLAGIFLPVICINRSDISEQENRTLTKFPTLVQNGKLNQKFSSNFNDWIGDRFWGRNTLIDARFKTLYKINGRIENDKAFIADDGWMFNKFDTINISSIEKQKEKINNVANVLKQFDDKFKDKRIPIYLMIPPDRAQIEQKYWERYYKPKPKLDHEKELITLLSDHPNIRIIKLSDIIQETNKNHPVFLKTDGHFNVWGEYIYQKAFVDQMQKDFLYNNEDIQFKTEQSEKKFGHRAIKADLGFPLVDERVHYGPKISVDLPKAKWKRIEREEPPHIYYEYGITENAPIDRVGIFMAPCYMNFLFFKFRKLFKESYHLNLRINGFPKEIDPLLVQKIKKLYEFTSNSTTIILFIEPLNFSHNRGIQAIEKSLEE